MDSGERSPRIRKIRVLVYIADSHEKEVRLYEIRLGDSSLPSDAADFYQRQEDHASQKVNRIL